jgi:serine/threonine protein kinase
MASSPSFEASAIHMHYQLEEKIGSGTFATVYKAKVRGSAQYVAIKIVQTKGPIQHLDILSEVAICRFFHGREAVGVVQCYDMWATPFQMVMVMELYKEDLSAALQLGHINDDYVGEIFWQVTEGVASLHEHNVIHRDLHLGNIFLARTRQGHRIAVGDFNKAIHVEESGDKSLRYYQLSICCAAASAMAPECAFAPGTVWGPGNALVKRPLECKYGFPVDIWALAMVHLALHGFSFYASDDPCWNSSFL